MRLIALFWVAVATAQDYAGSKACAGCHKQIHEHWLRSSMGRSMSPASEHLGKAPAAVRVKSEKLRRDFSVFGANGQLKQREEGEGFRNEHALAWAIGSGINGLSFVVQRGDHLFQAPLSFYSRVGQWDLSPGYEFADYGFNRPIAAGCIHCHSGRPRTVAGGNGQFQDPPFQELAIGCENCHGPGKPHIAQRGAKGSIVNPAKIDRARADEICMNCHQAGDTRVLQPGKTESDYKPGMALNDVVAIFKLPRAKDNDQDKDLLEHHESMRLSRCYRQSGTMSCQTCHSPHAAKVDYQAKCVGCHAGKLATGHPDSKSNCVECHMPKREIKVIAHSALTNHRIVRRPGQALPAPSATGDELIHLNGVGNSPLPLLTRMQAYGLMSDRQPAYYDRFQNLLNEAAAKEGQNPLVLAALGRRSLRAGQFGDAVRHLRAALDRGSKAASTYEDLGDALGKSGLLEESARALEAGVAAAPFTPVLYKTLALRYIQLKQFEDAKRMLARYVDLFPEDDFVRKLLAQVSGPR